MKTMKGPGALAPTKPSRMPGASGPVLCLPPPPLFAAYV